MNITVAVDAMGGDHGPAVTVPAVIDCLTRYPDLSVVLVGDLPAIHAVEPHPDRFGERLTLQAASQTVGMNEPPSSALRGKRDSSMRVSIDLVRDGRANACVSAGNTGALMAIARFVLKTLDGIDRPAICTALPTRDGSVTRVLDLGANVDCTAEDLYQFAVMGTVLAQEVAGIAHPRVALLNVGEEEIKGNDEVKRAATLLSASALNYIGFAEGNDIFDGRADVIACDGFVGNVALKATEGVARMIGHYTREAFQANWRTRIAGLFAAPVLRSLRQRIDPRRYNGASLLGLRGVVVKSHGGADSFAFARALEEAMAEGRERVPDRIAHAVSSLLGEA
ncbi:MAG TPA: phosphate acyltransferase PlsX [Gammaproteobacteria bacterium]|nr:phosphate acyltransferase PlsX [Gammaproteobacteria bacterium]